jgi:hypothetical protein
MADLLAQCNSGKLRTNPKEFQEVWCVRCSQPGCDLAKFAQTDPMARRQATWREEFFGKPQADTRIPKFAQIAGLDFKDMLEKAVKLEVSTRRGDWSVPEINISDGRIIQAPEATARQVEEAVRQLHQATQPFPTQEEPLASEEFVAGEPDDPPVEEIEPPPLEPEQPREVVESTPPVEELPAAPPSQKLIVPRAGNTPDRGEVMLGGAPAPSARPRPQPEADPWAPPPKSTTKVVKKGATIVFGAGGQVKVIDD